MQVGFPDNISKLEVSPEISYNDFWYVILYSTSMITLARMFYVCSIEAKIAITNSCYSYQYAQVNTK